MSVLNHEPLRREDDRLLRGRGVFVHNLFIDGCCHAVFVRSVVSNAAIKSIAVPAYSAGIFAVFTGENFAAAHMPQPNPIQSLLRKIESPVLPTQQIDYVGQALAVVIATSFEAARDFAETIFVETEDLSEADDLKFGEVLAELEYSKSADIENVHAQVDAQLLCPRLISMSLEPRGCVAIWDDAAQKLTVHLPTQSPARARDDIAACLQIEKTQVRIITGDVGGAFGAKATVNAEDLAICLAAKHLKKTITWKATRSEEFLSGMQGRGSELWGSLSLNADGKFLQLQTQLDFSLGAWLPFSAPMPMRNAARILPGPYHVQALSTQTRARRTHTAPINIYRGAGRPEAVLLMETLVERAGRDMKMDSLELRRRNLIAVHEMPFETLTGEVLDSGDYLKLLDTACERFGYEAARAAQSERRAKGKIVGIGMALYNEPCGQGFEVAKVQLKAGGVIEACVGSPAQGQGHETTFAQIAYEALRETLGCEIEDIHVNLGDTDTLGEGIGALASRSIAIGGSALKQACEAFLSDLKEKELLQKWKLLPHDLPAIQAKFTSKEAWAAGCVIAQMTIDRETGEPAIERITWADDAGRIISPTLAHGQLIGGLAQGLGQAMMERMVYDDSGQLITGSLMDYALPRAADMPTQIDMVSLETLSPLNALGAKGVGEAGCIGVPAALMNAARDALSVFGECELQFPLTSEQLWRNIQSK